MPTPAEITRLVDGVAAALYPPPPTVTNSPGLRIKVSSRILQSSVANPTVLTTVAPHGIESGVTVRVSGHSGSTPALSGLYVATRINETQFSLPVTVTVAGSGGRVLVERDAEPGGIEFTELVNGATRGSAAIYDMKGEFRPEHDADVVVEEDGVEIFKGFVTEDIEESAKAAAGAPIMVRFGICDYHDFLDRVLVSLTVPSGTLKSHLQALIPYVSAAPFSITLSTTQADGPIINLQVYEFKTVREILDGLTTLSGGWLYDVSTNRELSMAQPSIGVPTAEYHLTEGDERVEGDLVTKRSRPHYRNRVFVRAGAGAEVQDRFETLTVGVHGIDLGDYTYYPFSQPAVSFTEQPTSVLVNGTPAPIGAPGTTNNGTPWEWFWWWSVGGSGLSTQAGLVHNDAVYGASTPGTTLGVWNKGFLYYNTTPDGWSGAGYTGPSDGYRWYWGGVIAARSRSLPPHTVFVNGVAALVGAYGTTNEIFGTSWDWVWRSDNPPLLGHRQTAAPLTGADNITLYSLAPYKLVVQVPPSPSAEQAEFGVWDELVDAPNVFSYADAYQLGNNWLQRRLVKPLGVTYETLHGRLTPGKVQAIYAPRRNINGNFLIVEVETRSRQFDLRVQRTVRLVDSATYINTWRDEFAQWVGGGQTGSGSGTSITISGTPVGGTTGGGAVAYTLSMREDGAVTNSSPGAWATVSGLQARIDSVARGSTAAVAYLRVKALESGVSVTVRVRNASTGNIVAGPSTPVVSTEWTWVTLPVTLDAGTGYYELQVLPGTDGAYVSAIGWIE